MCGAFMTPETRQFSKVIADGLVLFFFQNTCNQHIQVGRSADISTQRTHGVIIRSLLRQNGVVTSFWRNNDVIVTPDVHWAVHQKYQWNPFEYQIATDYFRVYICILI